MIKSYKRFASILIGIFCFLVACKDFKSSDDAGTESYNPSQNIDPKSFHNLFPKARHQSSSSYTQVVRDNAAKICKTNFDPSASRTFNFYNKIQINQKKFSIYGSQYCLNQPIIIPAEFNDLDSTQATSFEPIGQKIFIDSNDQRILSKEFTKKDFEKRLSDNLIKYGSVLHCHFIRFDKETNTFEFQFLVQMPAGGFEEDIFKVSLKLDGNYSISPEKNDEDEGE